MSPLLRKGHFLGAKLRSLRKRNALTLEELSARCIQRDAQWAPSVSYLSMIESGKRTPSQEPLGRRGPHPAGACVPVLQGRAAGGHSRAAGADRHDGASIRTPTHTFAPGD